LRKPIFVPKAERETIAERERLEAADAAQEEELRKRLEERKIETKQIVVEVIRQEEQRAKNQAEEGEDVETDDELNEEEEYEGWKARELARIKRDRAERSA
jgi:microfibrillar-associated protein 1